MKLNLLIDPLESMTKGPGRRAANLIAGLSKLGVGFNICSENYEYAVGLQNSKVFTRWESLPANTPIGPNVVHCATDHIGIGGKFDNFIVQSAWVADYWKWQHPVETAGYTFHTFPASVDVDAGYGEVAISTAPKTNKCLFYTKYQNRENTAQAQDNFKKYGHSSIDIVYGEYTKEELLNACLKSEYCIYNSCCEKSSNALLEILACGVPVYVVDSKRWIGDDKFDRCTSAPHFDERCGVIGDGAGKDFDQFYSRVAAGTYNPFEFILDGYTVDKIAQVLIDIVERCLS